jgi:hypothetical protein
MTDPDCGEQRLLSRIDDILQHSSEQARALDALFLVEVRGEPPRCWTLDLRADPPRRWEGRPEVFDCSIAADRPCFAALLDDPSVLLQLFFQGSITSAGNTALAAKFTTLFFHRNDSQETP